MNQVLGVLALAVIAYVGYRLFKRAKADGMFDNLLGKSKDEQ